MTVAPRMPSARYSISGLRRISVVGAKPRITPPQSGSAMAIWMPKRQRDDAQQRDDERLEPAEALLLQPQDQEHVQRGDQYAQFQRNAEQQVQADGGADHLGDVGGDDGDFGGKPQRDRDIARDRRRGRPAPDRGPRRWQGARTAIAARWPSGWKSARRTAAYSRTSTHRRARSPSCPGPYSRRRPCSPAQGKAAKRRHVPLGSSNGTVNVGQSRLAARAFPVAGADRRAERIAIFLQIENYSQYRSRRMPKSSRAVVQISATRPGPALCL